MIQTNLFTKQKQTHRLREQTYNCQGEGQGRDRLRVLDGHVNTAIFKIDNQQGPTVQHRKLFNIMLQPKWGKNLKKN